MKGKVKVMSEKAKYWCAVLYPESMISDWKEIISEILQIPYSYCIHDKDKDGHDGDRKTHVHLILAFPNTTTYKHALSLVQELQPTCPIIKKVINIRYMFDYLIHDTESCKKKCKYLYSANERICGNNFDIGSYEQRSLEEKRADAISLKKYIYKYQLDNLYELDMAIDCDPDLDEDLKDRFQDAILSYSGVISNACKGVYLYKQKQREIALQNKSK